MYEANSSGDGFGFLFFLLFIAIYVFCAYTQFRIAKKCGCDENAWWAYVPIMNTILLMDMAGKERWWFFLCLVPMVNIVIFAILWFEVAKAAGHDGWIGLLVLVPFLNIIGLCILAFSGRSGGGTEFPRSGQIDPQRLTKVG